MAESEVRQLQRELKFRRLQLNSIHELSTAMQSQFEVDHVMRLFFSSLMAPLGLSRALFLDRGRGLLRKRGFVLSDGEAQLLLKASARLLGSLHLVRVEELPPALAAAQRLLLARRIHYLLAISEKRRQAVLLGLGRKFNQRELAEEDFEFARILSRFMLIQLDNIRFLAQILEKRKLEHEMKIARAIQLSLLPQQLPRLRLYDLAVIYEPIQEVGGDFYDILKQRRGIQPLALADVEGKGLAAAMLAASCQAVFHSMNELYVFKPARFIARANSFIRDITRGSRFITLLWLLLHEERPALTYVNAGHNAPWLVSGRSRRRLQTGGLLLGFSEQAAYEEETIALESGDVLCAYTDGVSEVQNPAGEEFGEEAIADFVQAHRRLPAAEIGAALQRRVKAFSQGARFRDDFTILIARVR